MDKHVCKEGLHSGQRNSGVAEQEKEDVEDGLLSFESSVILMVVMLRASACKEALHIKENVKFIGCRIPNLGSFLRRPQSPRSGLQTLDISAVLGCKGSNVP